MSITTTEQAEIIMDRSHKRWLVAVCEDPEFCRELVSKINMGIYTINYACPAVIPDRGLAMSMVTCVLMGAALCRTIVSVQPGSEQS